MFSTIAYYLGYADSGLPAAAEESCVPTFVAKEAENQWTLIDVKTSKNAGKNELSANPTPPPSPQLEQSWLLTPPPCFNAETSTPLQELNDRENMLIEHPSMFVGPPASPEANASSSGAEKQPVAAQQRKKLGVTPKTQRKAAHQAIQAIAQQSKRNYQLKKTSSNVAKRNNKSFKMMRQRVQQPRKRC